MNREGFRRLLGNQDFRVMLVCLWFGLGVMWVGLSPCIENDGDLFLLFVGSVFAGVLFLWLVWYCKEGGF